MFDIINRLNQYALDIYNHNRDVGWWPENPDDRDLYTCIQLIITEVAEATEGARKNLMDDHLPQYKMEAVELADALIRTLDLVGYWRTKYPGFMIKAASHHNLCNTAYSAAKQHLGIVKAVTWLIDTHEGDKPLILQEDVSYLIGSIIKVAENRGFSNIEEIMLAKINYNKQRADHKLENRAKEGGKKF